MVHQISPRRRMRGQSARIANAVQVVVATCIEGIAEMPLPITEL